MVAVNKRLIELNRLVQLFDDCGEPEYVVDCILFFKNVAYRFPLKSNMCPLDSDFACRELCSTLSLPYSAFCSIWFPETHESDDTGAAQALDEWFSS